MGQQSASTSILQLSAKVSASLPQPSREHPEASEKAPAEAKEANRPNEQQEYRPQQNLLLGHSALPLPYQRLGNNMSRSISHLQRLHQVASCWHCTFDFALHVIKATSGSLTSVHRNLSSCNFCCALLCWLCCCKLCSGRG